MAYTNKTKERFIEFRAKGYSFDKISKELKVSKPTLINWQLEFEKEISNLKYLEIQSLFDSYKETKKNKIENLLKMIGALNKEIAKRDFSEVPIKTLFDLLQEHEAKLFKLTHVTKYKTDEDEGFDFGKKKILHLF